MRETTTGIARIRLDEGREVIRYLKMVECNARRGGDESVLGLVDEEKESESLLYQPDPAGTLGPCQYPDDGFAALGHSNPLPPLDGAFEIRAPPAGSAPVRAPTSKLPPGLTTYAIRRQGIPPSLPTNEQWPNPEYKRTPPRFNPFSQMGLGKIVDLTLRVPYGKPSESCCARFYYRCQEQ